ncbi:unnamed protein product [Caenorhabditis angaria]|uniref:Uncharacterized protein n=1 Tax=Caenorhabditis angaria TaxID=860376 RepID=A0A9P1J4M3_9PELO|nr:unnamed protein product [Caenorhabditis angaria]
MAMLEFSKLANEERIKNEEKLEKSRLETEAELGKLRILSEKRRKQLDEQMNCMRELVIEKMWTMQLENLFTNWLNFLKTSNREVVRNYKVFRTIKISDLSESLTLLS